MRPLYDSYKETVTGCEKPEQFNHTLLEWLQNRMSLKTLRKGKNRVPCIPLYTLNFIFSKLTFLQSDARNMLISFRYF